METSYEALWISAEYIDQPTPSYIRAYWHNEPYGCKLSALLLIFSKNRFGSATYLSLIRINFLQSRRYRYFNIITWLKMAPALTSGFLHHTSEEKFTKFVWTTHRTGVLFRRRCFLTPIDSGAPSCIQCATIFPAFVLFWWLRTLKSKAFYWLFLFCTEINKALLTLSESIYDFRVIDENPIRLYLSENNLIHPIFHAEHTHLSYYSKLRISVLLQWPPPNNTSNITCRR